MRIFARRCLGANASRETWINHGVKYQLLEACSGTTIGILEQKFKPGAPWWSLFGVLSCDEIWKRRRRRGRKACATACSVRIFKIGSPSWVVIYLVVFTSHSTSYLVHLAMMLDANAVWDMFFYSDEDWSNIYESCKRLSRRWLSRNKRSVRR